MGTSLSKPPHLHIHTKKCSCSCVWHWFLKEFFEVIVGAGGGIAPVEGPPDGQQEQVHTVGQQTVVVSNYTQSSKL